jgi:hypothetical protein
LPIGETVSCARPMPPILPVSVGPFERALTLDPRSVEAQGSLAAILAGRVLDAITDTATADIERVERVSAEALAASPRSPLAHYAKGHVLRSQCRPENPFPNMRRCSRSIATG